MTEQFDVEPVEGEPAATAAHSADEHDSSQAWKTRLLIGIVGTVLVLLGTWGAVVATQQVVDSSGNDKAGSKTNVPEFPSLTDLIGDSELLDKFESDEQELKEKRLRAIEAKAIRDAQVERFAVVRDKCQNDLTEIDSELGRRDTLAKQLLDGEDGKYIAADAAYVERFAAMWESKLVSREDLDSYERQLEKLSSPLISAQSELFIAPGDELLEELQSLSRELARDLIAVKTVRRDAESLKRLAGNKPPADRSLREVLDELRDQESLARSSLLANVARKVTDEATEILKQKTEENARLEADIQLANLDDERARLTDALSEAKAKAEQDRKMREEEAARAELERQFTLEYRTMKDYLIPFTEEGTLQPVPGNYDWKATGELGPVSFSVLKGSGLLEQVKSARLQLYSGVFANHHKGDRSRGAFPNYAYQDPQTAVLITNIQKFLLKYGDVMVEKKLLAK